MTKKFATRKELLLEIENLQIGLEEAEETISAIRSGEVDALVVSGKDGDQIFTLKGADHSYQTLIEEMSEGALTFSSEGVIFYANRRFGEMLKIPLEKLIGSTITMWVTTDSLDAFQSLLKQDRNKKRREQLTLVANDGTMVPVSLSVSNPLITEMSNSYCLIATDLTEQKQTEAKIIASEKIAQELLVVADQSRLALLSVIEDEKKIGMVLHTSEEHIKSLLAEKEIILKEVHHRIKNNMNNIYGLLTLQAGALTDSLAIGALEDAANRVLSMAKLYDKLYQSADFQEMAIQIYLSSLVDDIIANFTNAKSVKIEKNIGDFHLDAKRLQPLGILINELLTNIMKYAFIDMDNGIITISASLTDSIICITVQDNGKGMPEGIDFNNSNGFGLTLVNMLTKQLKGNMRIERTNGTKFILEFKK